MTNPPLKLPFASQPEMDDSATLLADQALLDPHIPVMLSACSFIGKPLSKNQMYSWLFSCEVTL